MGVRRLEDALEIDWDGAGHIASYSARPLRLACPCAGCVDEMSGKPILDPNSVPEGVAPQAVELVGAYAIRIRWSDGHATGLYTFESLLSSCPCDSCRS